MTGSAVARPMGSAGGTGASGIALAAALIVGVAYRLLVGWHAPLWLDETFTGVIASEPTLAGLLHWCLNEIGGPVYYILIWSWEKIAGPGDTALRLPSLAFSVAAPTLIWFRGHPDRRLRQLWAAMLLLWSHGLFHASEARSYSLLILLCSAQAIAFVPMIERPSTRRALVWTTLSALVVLTHYHGAVISGVQGLAYLAWARGRALATWPAALVFAPVAGWMSVHLPLLARFAANGWYSTLDAEAWLALPGLLAGSDMLGWVAVAVVGATLISLTARGGAAAAFRERPGEALLAASGVASVLIVFAAGFVRPSFTPRYLVLFGPAVLFGLAWWACVMEKRMAHVGAVALAAFTGVALGQGLTLLRAPELDHRYSYNFEQPTRWLEERGTRRIVFLWDNPSAAMTETGTLEAVAGFFARRDGRPMTVVAPRLRPEEDPNDALPRLASRSGAAILWAYDLAVPHTRGARFPNRIEHGDPRFRCRDFGGGTIVVLACAPRPAGRAG